MIKKRERQKIIKAFGTKYSNQLITILTKAKIFNSNGEPFSQDSIRGFVNGIRSNERVEKKILIATEKKLQKQQS